MALGDLCYAKNGTGFLAYSKKNGFLIYKGNPTFDLRVTFAFSPHYFTAQPESGDPFPLAFGYSAGVFARGNFQSSETTVTLPDGTSNVIVGKEHWGRVGPGEVEVAYGRNRLATDWGAGASTVDVAIYVDGTLVRSFTDTLTSSITQSKTFTLTSSGTLQ